MEIANEFGMQVQPSASDRNLPVPIDDASAEDALRLALALRILAATLGNLAALAFAPRSASLDSGPVRSHLWDAPRSLLAAWIQSVDSPGFARKAYNDSS